MQGEWVRIISKGSFEVQRLGVIIQSDLNEGYTNKQINYLSDKLRLLSLSKQRTDNQKRDSCGKQLHLMIFNNVTRKNKTRFLRTKKIKGTL